MIKDNYLKMNRGDSYILPLVINEGTKLCFKQYQLRQFDKIYVGIMEYNQAFEDALIRKVLTITSPTNLAFGSRWESIPNMNISNKIIENEDSAKLNFFFLFAIFSLLYLFIIVPVVPAKASLAFCNEVINA